MGRVSDALERALIEGREQVVQTSPDQAHEISARVQSENVFSRESKSKANGEIVPNEIPELFRSPSLPFVKRLQRLLFGRGLEKIKEFPLIFQEKHSLAAEQYRILREQIKKLDYEKGGPILAIMSPVKGDGKSTVAANLAAMIAMDYDQQVLLIDADLRGPSIHNFFEIRSSPGLADFLSPNSDSDIMSYIQNTSVRGLQVLSAGSPTNLSAELLATDKMKSLLKNLPVQFPKYQIIIDTSPVLSTSDPLVLAQQVDKIVMVIRAGTTPRECLTEAIKSLDSDRIKGIILNGADLGPSSRYYYYYGRPS